MGAYGAASVGGASGQATAGDVPGLKWSAGLGAYVLPLANAAGAHFYVMFTASGQHIVAGDPPD
jgi:hypothetical protein